MPRPTVAENRAEQRSEFVLSYAMLCNEVNVDRRCASASSKTTLRGE